MAFLYLKRISSVLDGCRMAPHTSWKAFAALISLIEASRPYRASTHFSKEVPGLKGFLSSWVKWCFQEPPSYTK